MTRLSQIWEGCLSIIYPPRCLLCETTTDMHNQLCGACWKQIGFISQPHCVQCGFPFDFDMGEDALCSRCVKYKPRFDMMRSLFRYERKGKQLVVRFKYHDQTYLEHWFVSLWQRYCQECLEDVDYIVPVPLHRWRLFKRRYNQAAILAKRLAKATQTAFVPDMLIRVKSTKAQTGLSFNQRKLNVSQAFEFNNKYTSIAEGANVLLIDDVMTTGATIHACVRELKRYKVAKVRVLTLARVV